MIKNQKNIVITGANGFLGGWIAATLLIDTDHQLILPVRSQHDPAAVRELIMRRAAEINAEAQLDESRIVVESWDRLWSNKGEVPLHHWIHSAASMEYRNPKGLRDTNIGLTTKLIDLAKQHPCESFLHVSTAFSSGMIQDKVEEDIHTEAPDTDPTPYTWSKREAELVVSNSGLPWRVIRPGIVIGHSKTGAYDGKEVGPYQTWNTFHRLFGLLGEMPKDLLAPSKKLQVIHIDHFLNVFKAMWQQPDGPKVVHAVSDRDSLPSSRDLATHWYTFLGAEPPKCHDLLETLPESFMSRELKIFIRRSAENLMIAAHDWKFEIQNIKSLLPEALVPKATVESVVRCQTEYLIQISQATGMESLTPSDRMTA